MSMVSIVVIGTGIIRVVLLGGAQLGQRGQRVGLPILIGASAFDFRVVGMKQIRVAALLLGPGGRANRRRSPGLRMDVDPFSGGFGPLDLPEEFGDDSGGVVESLPFAR